MEKNTNYYRNLYNGLKNLVQHKIELVDILTIDDEPEWLDHLSQEELEVLLDAIQRNQDNVASIYLKVKAHNNFSKHKGSSAWYRLGASIITDEELTQKLANAEELEDCVDLLQGLIFMHPELISFDGEYYSPEGCIDLKGIEGEYKFYNYQLPPTKVGGL